MPELHFPWMELAILVPLIGAAWTHFLSTPARMLQHATWFACASFLLACGELVDFLSLGVFEAHDHWPYTEWLFPRNVFVVDELSAFLLPLGALAYLVTIMSTRHTKAPRFSAKGALLSEALLLATFSCRASWVLVVLLSLSVLPPMLELKARNRCTRIYALHMLVFVVLLVGGYAWLQLTGTATEALLLPGALLTAAALLRSGIFPFHLWITDLFEKASFGNAILFSTPLVGVYAVMRLVLPIAPSWALQSIAALSLLTAVYAASLAIVQVEARRMFCYLLLSQSSLVLVGLELVTPIGLTGGLCVWISVALSMTGFGITLRCIEARISRISLKDYHGLYGQMPSLAGFFLLTGLASIGFPLTVGFVGMELLIEGAVDVYPVVGMLVVVAAALNGIAILFAYFRIFAGKTVQTNIDLNARPSERIAVWLLSALILGGGLFPQPGVASRYHAAVELTKLRQTSPMTQSADAEPNATHDNN